MLLPRARDYLDIERQYHQIMFLYEAGINQLESRINILKREFQFSNDRNPIENIESRIKSKESILLKLKRKGLPMTVSALTNNIRDIAGIRVICPFIEDVYNVARMLIKQKDVELIEAKDYILKPKENGYRSLHLIVTTEVQFSNQTRKIPVEIQIRTIAMNFWASTEHQLRYKKDREFTDEVQKELKECADIMAQADRIMQNIAGEFNINLELW
ncbi:MAG: GTP pyrophosphokinase family protein [Lachnospira sp.]|nr:GTP pyrophosphokinase family protein [Lachnospira sp.]